MKFRGRYWSGYLHEEFPAAPPPEFLELYECVSDVAWALDPTVYEMQEEWRLGETIVPRRCSFCGKTELDSATFKSIAHAIPENLGNKRVISYEECDICNGKYSECELHIAKMFSVERIFSGARGKDGPTEAVAGPYMSLHGQGVGYPICLKIDSENNPIRYVGTNTLEFSVDAIQFRPVLALRSLLHSVWLVIPPEKRNSLESIRVLAMGENISYPFDYIMVVSPGAPPAMGRLRVWCLRSANHAQATWPPLIVAMNLFNTTIVWRAPLAGQYIASPLPPLPCYDEAIQLNIDRFSALGDELVSSKRTLSMHFEAKSTEPLENQKDVARVQPNPLAELRQSRDIRIAIGCQQDIVEWLQASRQVKRLSGDLSRIALMLIRASAYGVTIRLRHTDNGVIRLDLNFDGVGLPLAQALSGVRFSIAFFRSPPEAKLLLASDQGVQELSIEGAAQGPEVGERLARIEQQLLAFLTISQATSQDIVVPGSECDQNLIGLAALAISQRRLVSIKMHTTARLCLTHSEYERACEMQEAIIFRVGEVQYPYAGLSALTKDTIGPVYLAGEILNPAQQLPAAIVRQDNNIIELELKFERLLFIFERFL